MGMVVFTFRLIALSIQQLWRFQPLTRRRMRTKSSSLDGFPMMRRPKLLQIGLFLLVSFACLSGLEAQATGSSVLGSQIDEGDSVRVSPASPVAPGLSRPFSKLAVGPSFSPMGIGLDLTTNLNRRLNLRASG